MPGAGERLSYVEALGAAFLELIEHLPATGHTRSGMSLVIHVEEETLRSGVGAATVDSGGWISAAQVRRLACEAGILPMVIGGASVPLDLGSTTRLFTRAQAIALSATHDSCAAEGCERPFAWCELHHRTPWSERGPTDLANAAPLCGWHHRRVHDPHYQHQWTAEGTVRFRHRWPSRWKDHTDPWTTSPPPHPADTPASAARADHARADHAEISVVRARVISGVRRRSGTLRTMHTDQASGRPLPRSTPAEQEVDPAAVRAFLDTVEAAPGVELHSLMVVRHGHVVAEGWWAPYSAERPTLLYSLSKSFTSTAAAFAQSEGLLHLDDTLLSHFPELDADVTDPTSRSITLRHLAAMASGHTRDMLDEAFDRDPQEPVRGFLTVLPDREPGTVFAYSQPCTYALGAVIQRNAGMTLAEYLRPRLLDPLGIGRVGWQSWPAGRELGFTGLHARTEDVAKLGQLYLQRGRWAGVQLIPEEWVAEATTAQVDNPGGQDPDWRQGYGYQFWMSRHGYRGDGAFGQFCLVLPEQDAVVAMTAGTTQMQAVLDAVWTHLLPGLGRPGAGGENELAARLSGLRLQPCDAKVTPGRDQPWAAASFAVRGDPDESELTSVELTRADGAWQLTLAEDGNAVTVAFGSGEWAVSAPGDRLGGSVPVAASGGWLDEGTLRVEVVFLETPHRMDLTCMLRSRQATATWRERPLGQRALQHLHSPG